MVQGVSPKRKAESSADARLVQGEADSHVERVAPDRMARVLTKWISDSGQGLEMAQKYFRNLRLNEIETVAAHMHQDDLALLTRVFTSDSASDISSDDLHVLESRMRAEVSQVNTSDVRMSPDSPLGFLSQLDGVTLAHILRPESDSEIALVCTQLPVQRLHLLFSHLEDLRLASILAAMEHVSDLKPVDLIPVGERLRARVVAFESSLVRPDDQIIAAVQVLEAISDLSKRTRVAAHYAVSGGSSFEAIHKRVLILSDVAFFGKQALRVLAQAMDSQKFAHCFYLDAALGDLVADALPTSYGQIFRENLRSEPTSAAQALAWNDLVALTQSLVDRGTISERDFNQAKKESRRYLELMSPLSAQPSDSPESALGMGQMGGAA
jgi:hypothetical protein